MNTEVQSTTSLPESGFPQSDIESAAGAIEKLLTGNDADTQPSPKALKAEPETEPKQAEPEADVAGPVTDGTTDDITEMDLSGDEAEPAAVDDPDATGVDEGASDDEPEPIYTVRVNGEETEVPISELLKGYSREADYTVKSQQAAELRRQAEEASAAAHQQIEAVSQERALYQQTLANVRGQLEATLEKEPDWDAMYQEDPLRYMRERDSWRDRQEKTQQLRVEEQRVAKVQHAEHQQQLQQTLAAERDQLLKVIPSWKDPQKAAAEQVALKAYGVSIGYTERDMGTVNDHKAVSILRKAYLYDQIVAKRKVPERNPAKKASQTVRPGSKRVPSSNATRANQRLAKSGSVKDAAKAISYLLG